MADICGNAEVIELLEAYLETARRGTFGHIAIAMTGHPNVAACYFAGDVALELSSQEALTHLRSMLDKSIANWTLPPQDESLDASYVRYNVANGPLGFDFLVWLIDAEMTRIREGAPPPLKVGFWLGHDKERISRHNRIAWLDNVFRPCLGFISAVEDERAVHGRCKEVFVPRDIVKASKAGERVPKLAAARYGSGNHVTITLREAEHDQNRNSNMPEWLQFADDIQTAGEHVIILRDTAKANETLPGFGTYAAASTNLTTRMKLYESAKANLFVENGPATLAIYGSRPWLQFWAIDENDKLRNPQHIKQTYGLEVGEQYPWSRSNQRIVWKPDTYDNIMSAWNELEELESNGTTHRLDHHDHADGDRRHHQPS